MRSLADFRPRPRLQAWSLRTTDAAVVRRPFQPKVVMESSRTLLLVGCATGIVAVVAGLAGFGRVVGGAAAVLFLIFLLLPWQGRR